MSTTQDRIEQLAKHTFGTWNRQSAWKSPLLIKDAKGVCFYDDKGKEYIDFSSMLICSSLGHKNQAIIEAIKKQADQLPYIAPGFVSEVAMEAMACWNPVVAFNQGGLKDIVDHKVNGYLVQPYDIDEMASGIQWMMDDAQHLNGMSAKAREKAIELVGENVVIEKLINIYRRLG